MKSQLLLQVRSQSYHKLSHHQICIKMGWKWSVFNREPLGSISITCSSNTQPILFLKNKNKYFFILRLMTTAEMTSKSEIVTLIFIHSANISRIFLIKCLLCPILEFLIDKFSIPITTSHINNISTKRQPSE